MELCLELTEPGTPLPARSGSAVARLRASEDDVQEANIVQQVMSLEWI